MQKHIMLGMLNQIQLTIANKLKENINEFLGPNIVLSLGFGSFWQDYKNLNDKSDIDFFVLISSLPKKENIFSFNEKLHDISTDYKFSPHIFLGEVTDLVLGEDNLIRILNIYHPGKNPPIVLVGNNNIDLLNLCNNYCLKIEEVLKANLFRTTRFFLQALIDNEKTINYVEHIKHIKRFIESFQVANTVLLNNKYNYVYKMLLKSYNKSLSIKCLEDRAYYLFNEINIIIQNIRHIEV